MRAFSGGVATSSSMASAAPAATIWPLALRFAGMSEFGEAVEHGLLVAAEDGGHRGGFGGAGLGHGLAADRREGDGFVGADDAGDGGCGELADGMAGDDGFGGQGAALGQLVVGQQQAATIRGWVTAVSVISSAVAVVPEPSRSRLASFDQVASWSRAPGSSSQVASMPGVCEPCPGARIEST